MLGAICVWRTEVGIQLLFYALPIPLPCHAQCSGGRWIVEMQKNCPVIAYVKQIPWLTKNVQCWWHLCSFSNMSDSQPGLWFAHISNICHPINGNL